MIGRIRELLLRTESTRRLTESKPEESVAVCVILLEMANVDGDFAKEESDHINQMLAERFSLNEQEVADLIKMAVTERAKSPDLWPFTNAIGKSYTPEQKKDLLIMVWRVIFADSRLDPHEEMLVRKLQQMLSVNQSVMIAAKQAARDIAGTSAPFETI